MAYLGTKPANQVIDSTLIANGTVTPSDLSTGAPYWSSSGNLGVGTSSPSQNLQVVSTTNGQGVLVSGSVDNVALNLSNSGTSGKTWGIFSANSNSGAGGGALGFFDGTAYRMILDSSGRVLTPAQPAFHAFPNTAYDTSTSNAVIPFNNTAVNIGSHYNTSTYRFTAPIAGLYFFSASFWAIGSSFGYMAIARNGDTAALGARGRIGGVGTYVYTTLNSIMYLNANDYIDCRCVDGSQPVHINNGYNNFIGYLLG